VLDASGSPVASREDAEVLVLGDSFSNIYSAGPMGWGESAGFVEHLMLHLGRPVDAIVRNGDGAWATRRMLAEDLARGRDRLAGKKVVIWQFAARELAVGNWKSIEMKPGPAWSGGFLSLKRGETVKASGVIKIIGAAPRPGTVPYKDHIVAAHLTGVKDEQGRPRGEAVVYLWSMRDNKAAPAAGYRPGQTVTLRLRPWAEVSRQYGSINRRELPDPALLTVDPLWAEEETP
jgi:alginate O-acetyltransferase complex protein AlgJ